MIDDIATSRVMKALAWCGPLWLISYLITWGIMGHQLPPPNQTLDATDFVNNFYVANRTSIEYGMALAAFFGVFYLPWSIALSLQMWQREKLPVLSIMQLAGAIPTAFLISCTAAIWVWCAHWAGQPGIDPQLIKTIHFVTWYVFDMTYNITNVQIFGCGLFALLDKTKPTIFPAWLGWVAIATALSFLGETVMPMFDHGALAIDGWWNFDVGFATWFVWFAVFSVYVLKEAYRASPAKRAAPYAASPMAGE